MSRAYRIRVSETETKVVHVDDGIELQLELLDVLPRERLSALLRRELVAEGFSEREDGSFQKEVEGIQVVVDASTGTVTIRRDESHEVEGSASAVVLSTEAAEGQRIASDAVATQIEQETQRLQDELTESLEQHLPAIRKMLDRLSTRVVAEALKERAAELGEIEEISEDPDTGSLTIRVKV